MSIHYFMGVILMLVTNVACVLMIVVTQSVIYVQKTTTWPSMLIVIADNITVIF